MIYADVFRRAIPWTKLLLNQDSLPNDLNLRIENRVSAIAAWTLLLLLAFGAVKHPLWWAALVPVTLLLACNWALYRLFYRRRGFLFSLGAIGLHWLYYLYSSAVFVVVTLQASLRSVSGSAQHLRPEPPPRPLIVRD